MIKSKKLIVLIALCFVLALVGGLHAGAEQALKARNEGECWYFKNIAHQGAEAARIIGGDNEAVLAYFGKAWTDYNNLQKEMVAKKQEQETKANLQYLGNYQLTAYPSGTGPNSYNGKSQTLNYTAASDSIPGGTWIYIEGYGEYYVEDSGVGNDYTVDLYMGDYNTCMQFGRKYNVPVYKILNR